MSTTVRPVANSSGRFELTGFIRDLWRVHAPLTLTGLLMVFLTLFFGAGIFLDDRAITGAPAWLKPTKFAISITLYTLTLTWILGFVDRSKAWRRRVADASAWIVVLAFAIEMTALVTQVVRGTSSHFNVATPFDAAMFSAMGLAILVLWFTNFVFAGLLLFQRFDSAAFGWGLRMGLLITIFGMGQGFLMTNPTARQMASWEAGAPVTIVGAHSVGVVDGGAGLPVTGWSTEGGDLRIGHFVGMHALQVLPFVGWFASRRRRLVPSRQTALVWIGGLGYAAITLLLTWQALRSQPLIRPDPLTAGVFLAVVLGSGVSAALVLRQRRPAQGP